MKIGSKTNSRDVKQQASKALKNRGLTIREEKIQLVLPITFLGTKITLTSLQPEKPVIDFPNPLTLNALQSFLGNLSWLSPCLPILTSQLQPLFDLFKDNKDP